MMVFYLYMLTITLVRAFIKEKFEEMLKHNLKDVFVRKTIPDIQVFFLLNQYLDDDEEYWSTILSKPYSKFGVIASAGDDRYWKKLGGISWGYTPFE